MSDLFFAIFGTTDRIVAEISAVAAIVGAAAAVIQTVRFNVSKLILRQKNAHTWAAIQTTGQAYDKIDKIMTTLEGAANTDHDVLRRSAEVREALKGLWFNLILQAIEDEREFTQQTVELWAKMGRLENAWRITAVQKLAPPVNKEQA